MGGAQPRRMTVISPAIGPVWAVLLMAPSLPTAALPRPWWLLQTRQATAWRALASAREVGVRRQIPTPGLGHLPVADVFVRFCSGFLPILSAACRCCTQVVHDTCSIWLYCGYLFLLCNSSGYHLWVSRVKCVIRR